jgi:hypothetical protein
MPLDHGTSTFRGIFADESVVFAPHVLLSEPLVGSVIPSPIVKVDTEFVQAAHIGIVPFAELFEILNDTVGVCSA